MSGLGTLSRRSAVTSAEVVQALPGDGLVPGAQVVIDRGMVLPASPDQLWPWLVQLGKGRAGWYLPTGVERMIPPQWRGARRIIPAYQALGVGDEVPDWGPGDPVFRVAQITPPSTLVYLSLRDRADDWRWPHDGTAERPGVLALSWALVITPLPRGGSQLHIRLRINQIGRRFPELTAALGGLMDLATIVGLRFGLTERVLQPPGA